MDAATRAVLNEAETLLIEETSREVLSALDEDAAIELETRIRRARGKYVSQYRRGASARVAEHGGRGRARPENARAAQKAEAFERALSRVSLLAPFEPRSPRRSCAPSGWRWPGTRSSVTGREPGRWCPGSAVPAPGPPPSRPAVPGTARCATRPVSGPRGNARHGRAAAGQTRQQARHGGGSGSGSPVCGRGCGGGRGGGLGVPPQEGAGMARTPRISPRAAVAVVIVVLGRAQRGRYPGGARVADSGTGRCRRADRPSPGSPGSAGRTSAWDRAPGVPGLRWAAAEIGHRRAGARGGGGAPADQGGVPRHPLPAGLGEHAADLARADPDRHRAGRGSSPSAACCGGCSERSRAPRRRPSSRRPCSACGMCVAVTRAGREQRGDHRRRRHGQIGADHDGAGDGAVHRPVRRGVL